MAVFRQKADEPAEAPRALTAATAMVGLGEGSSWKTWKFGNKDWQAEVWRLYDIVPEFHFLAGRIGDSIAKARLYVTEVDDTGEETGEAADEAIKRLAAIPLGTGADRDGNLRLAGIDLAAPGECWLVGEGAAKDPLKAGNAWFVVTAGALRSQGGRVEVRRPRTRDGGWLTLTDGVDVLIRCWREHPNDTDQADSFARSAIPPLREIELLTKREFAELDSRLTGAGMLPVPESIDFPRDPEQGDKADITGAMAYLQRAAAASMRDQSNASAMVPIMFTVPDHLMDAMKGLEPIRFWSELSGEIGPMKDRAIARLAASAEIPAEVLTGIGNANHWTAWLISEEGIRWIGGYLSLIADALTRGFLRLALEKMGVEKPERYAYAFDTSTLAARPNRLEEAEKLHDRGLISDEELVKAAAFSADQMPKPEQRVMQLLRSLVLADPSLARDKAVQSALGLPEIAGVDTSTPDPIEPVSDDLSGRNDPPELDAGEANEVPALTASLDARILAARDDPRTHLNAASKLIVKRALELAGGRLATPAERHGCWKDVPRHELHFHVGPITPAKALKVTEGAWNHIGEAAADLGLAGQDAANYERLLSGYVHELLTRGLRHEDDFLFQALGIANRGRGLISA